MKLTLKDKNQLASYCYLTNNRFSYKYDRDLKVPEDELKLLNFVPTYDKWCLFCDSKNCLLRCSKCKYVYFCNKECQQKSWKIHKKHCNRDLFSLCINCGLNNTEIKCENKNCKIGYCSEKCKNILHSNHLSYDCKNLIV